MQIRTFRAASIKQAIQLVKKEMGSEAMIVSIRTVRDGAVKFGAKNQLEVTASIDREAKKAAPGAEPAFVANDGREGSNGDAKKTEPDTWQRELCSLHQRLNGLEKSISQEELTKRLDELVLEMGGLKEAVQQAAVTGRAALAQKEIPFEGDLGELYEKLLLSGIGERDAQRFVKQTSDQLVEKHLSPSMYGLEYVARELMEKVRIADPFAAKRQQQVHMIVGPTGVGKTTTIAKLAAQQVFEFEKSLALLTVDTYRIGAVDQLRTYARILDVPLDVCLSPVELVDAVRRHADKDVLFIDTAGASQKDAEMMGELAKVHQAGVPMDVHLIVSATTGDGALLDIAQRYTAMPLSSLIVSKLDEAFNFGGVYNLMRETNLPYSYFTVGQSVPDDIERATPERVVDLLLSISSQ